jgi:hypothetical protein
MTDNDDKQGAVPARRERARRERTMTMTTKTKTIRRRADAVSAKNRAKLDAQEIRMLAQLVRAPASALRLNPNWEDEPAELEETLLGAEADSAAGDDDAGHRPFRNLGLRAIYRWLCNLSREEQEKLGEAVACAAAELPPLQTMADLQAELDALDVPDQLTLGDLHALRDEAEQEVYEAEEVYFRLERACAAARRLFVNEARPARRPQ